jgi:hypothetical protein
MDSWPSTPLSQDLRNVADDVHHGIRQRGAQGEADALAHIFMCAKEAGVPDNERQRMATEQFKRLLDDLPRNRRRESRRKVKAALLGRSAHVKELPTGEN